MGKIKPKSKEELLTSLKKERGKIRKHILTYRSRTRESLKHQKKFESSTREAIPILEAWVAQFPKSAWVPKPWEKVLPLIEHLTSLALCDLFVTWSEPVKQIIKNFEIEFIAPLVIPCSIRKVNPLQKLDEVIRVRSLSLRFIYHLLKDSLPALKTSLETDKKMIN